MINEIYINGNLVLTENPKKQFKQVYHIRCVKCFKLVERKWYDKKILESPYECKLCVLKYRNPMYDSAIKKKHDNIVKSKEYRENMSSLLSGKNNPFYGKRHTNETIQKIIKANEDYRNNLTDTERSDISKRCSRIQKKLLNDNPEDYRQKRSKAARISHKSQFENREMNKIEKIVSEYLQQNKMDFIYSVILGSYEYDFKLKNRRILIEVDGDYWHGNPKYYNNGGFNGKRKLNEVQLNKIERDIEKTKWAESRGFTVIRIWESEINDDSYKIKLDELKKN